MTEDVTAVAANGSGETPANDETPASEETPANDAVNGDGEDGGEDGGGRGGALPTSPVMSTALNA